MKSIHRVSLVACACTLIFSSLFAAPSAKYLPKNTEILITFDGLATLNRPSNNANGTRLEDLGKAVDDLCTKDNDIASRLVKFMLGAKDDWKTCTTRSLTIFCTAAPSIEASTFPKDFILGALIETKTPDADLNRAKVLLASENETLYEEDGWLKFKSNKQSDAEPKPEFGGISKVPEGLLCIFAADANQANAIRKQTSTALPKGSPLHEAFKTFARNAKQTTATITIADIAGMVMQNAATQDESALALVQQNNPFLLMLKTLHVTSITDDDTSNATLLLKTISPEAATQTHDMILGYRALITTMVLQQISTSTDSPITNLINKIKIVTSNEDVILSLTTTAAEGEAIQKEFKRIEKEMKQRSRY